MNQIMALKCCIVIQLLDGIENNCSDFEEWGV